MLDVAQFPTTSKQVKPQTSLFEIMIGQQLATPLSFAIAYEGRSPVSFKFAEAWHEQPELAHAYLHKASKMMKKWVDKKHRHVEFNEGDFVLINLLPQQFKAFKKVHKGLL